MLTNRFDPEKETRRRQINFNCKWISCWGCLVCTEVRGWALWPTETRNSQKWISPSLNDKFAKISLKCGHYSPVGSFGSGVLQLVNSRHRFRCCGRTVVDRWNICSSLHIFQFSKHFSTFRFTNSTVRFRRFQRIDSVSSSRLGAFGIPSNTICKANKSNCLPPLPPPPFALFETVFQLIYCAFGEHHRMRNGFNVWLK